MSSIQYTIRSVPKSVDVFLRKKAQEEGRSLNQTVIAYVKKAITEEQAEKDDFSWLFGANTIDDVSLQAIKDMKEYDKQKQKRDERELWHTS